MGAEYRASKSHEENDLELESPDLAELLSLSPDEFRRRYRHTALWRGKRRGLLRNAAIALGNIGDARALPALERALSDTEPLVREAAAWAIQRIRGSIGEPQAGD